MWVCCDAGRRYHDPRCVEPPLRIRPGPSQRSSVLLPWRGARPPRRQPEGLANCGSLTRYLDGPPQVTQLSESSFPDGPNVGIATFH